MRIHTFMLMARDHIAKQMLIGDVGSTSSNWVLLENGKVMSKLVTSGFNPLISRDADLKNMMDDLRTHFSLMPALKAIYHYGAGMIGPQERDHVGSLYKENFSVEKMVCASDLLGAARATCGRKKGIVCILGTGSNSCYFDGKLIRDQFPGLGYPLGDEGSGWHIGADLIRAWYYDQLPERIRTIMADALPVERREFLAGFQSQENPNRYLAGFVRHLKDLPKDPYILSIVRKHFNRFIDVHLTRYAYAVQVHFVGSIAWHYADLLVELLRQRKFQAGKILQTPIDALAQYHLQNRLT